MRQSSAGLFARVEENAYNGFNQLVSQCVSADGVTTNLAFGYYPDGIRSTKLVNSTPIYYAVNNGYVSAEYYGDDLTAVYLWGANLIKSEIGSDANYYLYNAHGDVIQLADESGNVVYAYAYDAFGVEDEPDSHDANPFRYCGEYFDRESGKYYLRARYYDQKLGRFTQEDTHWNPKNMIYGDDPVKINEREDRLGLKHYAYAPDRLSVMQSGNLYGYCVGNPVLYLDKDGESLLLALAVGFAIGALVSGGCTVYNNVKTENNWYDGLAISMLAGGIGGAISCITIPGVSNFACAVFFGATGNLVTEVILGDIKSIDDVVFALGIGAASGLLGACAAELLTESVTKYFTTLTKSAQKDFLKSVGNITNRELTAIRQEIAKGLTPEILEKLVEKYGYDVIVSAFVSSTSASFAG